ncbi:F-box associated domain type 1 [Arabidopsis thaliana x Arabidopsis arenosa]|uniref:F-box associated domain type 1 n=1 Tax=Arabidopsis thaliana x Arabidopsis arenosa TaxID=1240361 RepID=A0A8T2AT85_9BRAS|nr:F-box associated domain type 1 [Arabidopsis thaliana x Arabidopsis arenosa]
MTTTMSNLPEVLVEEIISRVPITSLRSFRSSCKKWEALSKTHLLGGKAAEVTTRKQLLGFILVDDKICSMKLDLHGITKDGDDFVDTSVNQVSALDLDEFSISQIFHCDGLLLCVFNNDDSKRLMVCNMYLGETRFIKPRRLFERFDKSGVYAFGYDDSSKNRNHKILRNKSVGGGYEIYSFRSDSWKVLNVDLEEDTQLDQQGSLPLKGNAFFLVTKTFEETLEVGEDLEEAMDSEETEECLLCFDFKTERFGQLLDLPFHSEVDDDGVREDNVVLSCVRDEQLAVLCQSDTTICIWISTEIEPNAVSWREFLEVDLTTVDGFPDYFKAGSFFVDEEKQVAVVFDQETEAGANHTACIIGKDGYFNSVNVGDIPPPYFTSYVPSLVSLQIKKKGKRKARDY